VGGILESITDGYNGFLLPVDAPLEAVIEKVEEIMQTIDSDKMNSIRRKAREVAVNKYDVHVVARELEKLYQEMANE